MASVHRKAATKKRVIALAQCRITFQSHKLYTAAVDATALSREAMFKSLVQWTGETLDTVIAFVAERTSSGHTFDERLHAVWAYAHNEHRNRKRSKK